MKHTKQVAKEAGIWQRKSASSPEFGLTREVYEKVLRLP
jgi:hypothetical protein